MSDMLAKFLQDTALQYPFLMTVIMVLGVFRAVFKPAMSLLQAYVLATPSKDDDAKLQAFEGGKVYKTVIWLVDYIASIKIPPKAADSVLPSGAANDSTLKPS